MFLLSRVVRSFGTEDRETNRYRACLGMLRRISIRQAVAYLLYLVTNASLFNLTKVRTLRGTYKGFACCCGCARRLVGPFRWVWGARGAAAADQGAP